MIVWVLKGTSTSDTTVLRYITLTSGWIKPTFNTSPGDNNALPDGYLGLAINNSGYTLTVDNVTITNSRDGIYNKRTLNLN